MITGLPKAGKPWLTLDLKTEAGPVLTIDLENGRPRTARRIKKLAQGRDLSLSEIPFYYCDELIQDNEEGFAALKAMCEEISPSPLVIDPLVAYIVGDENSAVYIRSAYNKLKRLAAEHDCAIVVVHHPRKQASGEKYRGSNSVRGSGDIVAAPDTHIEITGSRKTCCRLELRLARNGIDEGIETISYKMIDTDDSDMCISRCGVNPESKETKNNVTKPDRAKESIPNIMDCEGMRRKDLIDRAMESGPDISKRAIDSALGELEKAEKVERRKEALRPRKHSFNIGQVA